MLIKDRVYRTCKSCKERHHVSSEVYGCDTCRKLIDPNKPKADYLRANVFRHDQTGNSEGIIVCSWKCMAKALRNVKSDYFVALPMLHYDDVPKGMRAEDFFALLRSVSSRAKK